MCVRVCRGGVLLTIPIHLYLEKIKSIIYSCYCGRERAVTKVFINTYLRCRDSIEFSYPSRNSLGI